MLLQSIRFKIVLWHMFILSLALFIFGMVLYHNLYLKIADDTDDVLRSRSKGIEESIDTYWEAERIAIAEGVSKSHFSKQDNINFIRIARRWVGEKINDPDLINTVQEKIEKVTKADIQRVAQKYLTAENRALVISVPKPTAAGAGGGR